jgi:hypothetical protein
LITPLRLPPYASGLSLHDLALFLRFGVEAIEWDKRKSFVEEAGVFIFGRSDR